MSYAIKEIYPTLQGEGAHTGRSAVFLRFSGCNLWSGREEDRHKAICQFCDTDFWGVDGIHGGRYEAEELAKVVRRLWNETYSLSIHDPYVVCTGGEPLLQLDTACIDALHREGIEIAIETNGTLPVPKGIDWICMSPKAGTEIVVTTGDELKVVYPQNNLDPLDFSGYLFEHFFIQPMDGPDLDQNILASITFCAAHPVWELSLQTHKLLAIP